MPGNVAYDPNQTFQFDVRSPTNPRTNDAGERNRTDQHDAR